MYLYFYMNKKNNREWGEKHDKIEKKSISRAEYIFHGLKKMEGILNIFARSVFHLCEFIKQKKNLDENRFRIFFSCYITFSVCNVEHSSEQFFMFELFILANKQPPTTCNSLLYISQCKLKKHFLQFTRNLKIFSSTIQ